VGKHAHLQVLSDSGWKDVAGKNNVKDGAAELPQFVGACAGWPGVN
jgi:hypothetical protein